jgi:hypothetical protein
MLDATVLVLWLLALFTPADPTNCLKLLHLVYQVRRARPIIFPNQGFVAQLERYDTAVHTHTERPIVRVIQYLPNLASKRSPSRAPASKPKTRAKSRNEDDEPDRKCTMS